MTIEQLIAEAHATALEKGWWGESGKVGRSMGDQFANFHSELSEAWEVYREGRPLEEVRHVGLDAKPEGFAVEMADVWIRMADTLGAYGLTDVFLEALKAKLRYNRTRSHRHGNKLA